MAYLSLASCAEVGSCGTSFAGILWLGFEKSPHRRDLVKVHPPPNTGSTVLAPFLVDLCLACSCLVQKNLFLQSFKQ